MRMTIDKAGRVVIPAALRRKAGLQPGTPLAATFENGGIRIMRDVTAPQITRRGERRIATPSKKDFPTIDIATYIEEERERWPL